MGLYARRIVNRWHRKPRDQCNCIFISWFRFKALLPKYYVTLMCPLIFIIPWADRSICYSNITILVDIFKLKNIKIVEISVLCVLAITSCGTTLAIPMIQIWLYLLYYYLVLWRSSCALIWSALGRPRRRWEYNIKTHLTEVKCGDGRWMELIQGRIELVVLKLRILPES
jgi:hypothetical protein